MQSFFSCQSLKVQKLPYRIFGWDLRYNQASGEWRPRNVLNFISGKYQCRKSFRSKSIGKGITELVLDLILAPRNIGPKNFGVHEMWAPHENDIK